MYGLQDPSAEIEYRQQRVRSTYRRANPNRPGRAARGSRTNAVARPRHGLRRLHLAWPTR